MSLYTLTLTQFEYNSSTGVQIGGPKSAMGVVGVWTTTHHDQGNVIKLHTSFTFR